MRAGLQPDRFQLLPQGFVGLQVAWASSSPAMPRSAARMTTHGMPLSIMVTAMPSIVVDRIAGGQQSAAGRPGRVLEDDRHRRGRAGHAVDAGDPFIAHAPARRVDRGVATWLVFSMKMRTSVVPSRAPTSPRSIAKGPTPARMLPQFCWSVTIGLSTKTCRKR